jgi:hypothetical protein
LFSELQHAPRILDFGCGKSELVDKCALYFKGNAFRYDPAIDAYSSPPKGKFDLVINTDVLEHLDESEIDLVLHDISRLTDNCFFNISTRKAGKILSNGENAHSTIQNKVFWKRKLKKFFPTVVSLPSKHDEAIFVTYRVSAIFRVKSFIFRKFNIAA